jgi:hypothetical protein
MTGLTGVAALAAQESATKCLERIAAAARMGDKEFLAESGDLAEGSRAATLSAAARAGKSSRRSSH